MIRTDRRLPLALALSLILHALPFLPGLASRTPPTAPFPVLQAKLVLPPAPEQPPLMLPERPEPAQAPRTPRPPRPEQPPVPKASASTPWTAEVKRQLRELDRQGRFYPEEAIARGLEGEVLVLLVLDEAGNPAAARVERSSGQPLLDEAALKAVRSLRSLPAAAPRETLLPVRFRLR